MCGIQLLTPVFSVSVENYDLYVEIQHFRPMGDPDDILEQEGMRKIILTLNESQYVAIIETWR